MVKTNYKNNKITKKINVENQLRTAGLSDRVAKEVADRVNARGQEFWSKDKINQETSCELRRLQEEIENAYEFFESSCSMAVHNVGEQRRTARKADYVGNEKPRKETMVECTNVVA